MGGEGRSGYVRSRSLFWCSGCLYCFGVAFDVYVVRIFLAPAALCIFENMNYWPGKVPEPFVCSLDVFGCC